MPILYFLGRYELAGRLLESALAPKLNRPRPGMSYDCLFHIYKPLAEPRARHEVTLFHIYKKLGKSLVEWSHWKRFVKGLHPRVFAITGVNRDELSRNPLLLRRLFNALEKEMDRRHTIINVTRGEVDVIEPPSKVKRYQESVARKIRRLDPAVAAANQELEDIFPELKQRR